MMSFLGSFGYNIQHILFSLQVRGRDLASAFSKSCAVASSLVLNFNLVRIALHLPRSLTPPTSSSFPSSHRTLLIVHLLLPLHQLVRGLTLRHDDEIIDRSCENRTDQPSQLPPPETKRKRTKLSNQPLSTKAQNTCRRHKLLLKDPKV